MTKYFLDQLARAAATDKANRRMRKAGRTRWNLSDFRCAVREYYRLLPNGPVPHCQENKLT